MDEVEKLRETVEAFCCFIENLPEEVLVEQDWGPKEVLAHLIFHHESYAEQVKALLSGHAFEPPRGRFRGLNEQAVQSSRGVPVAELVARFRKTDELLRSLYTECNPEVVVLEIKKGAKLRTLAELVPEVEAHIRNHQKKLEKKMK